MAVVVFVDDDIAVVGGGSCGDISISNSHSGFYWLS